jgi:acetyltransferase-like isoleucine patch superfamily enzyme
MGSYCTVCNHSTVEGIVRFGDGVRVMSHVYIPTRTWFGDHVFIGPGVNFLNARYPGREEQETVPRGAFIESEVVIGGGVTVLPGVRIGERSFIAAGALVCRDIPARSLVVGVPGRIQPLPSSLDRNNSRRLTMQPKDLWHPEIPCEEHPGWPEDWPETFR